MGLRRGRYPGDKAPCVEYVLLSLKKIGGGRVGMGTTVRIGKEGTDCLGDESRGRGGGGHGELGWGGGKGANKKATLASCQFGGGIRLQASSPRRVGLGTNFTICCKHLKNYNQTQMGHKPVY